jgi:hypothetical protein
MANEKVFSVNVAVTRVYNLQIEGITAWAAEQKVAKMQTTEIAEKGKLVSVETDCPYVE